MIIYLIFDLDRMLEESKNVNDAPTSTRAWVVMTGKRTETGKIIPGK